MTQELKDNIQDEKTMKGYIRLGMADSLCQSMLIEGFDQFWKHYPGLMLKIIPAGTEEMLRLLNHNEVDAILTLDNPIYNREYMIAAGGKGRNAFCSREKLSVEKKKEDFSAGVGVLSFYSHRKKGMSYRRLLEERLAEMSLEVEPVLEIGSTDLICKLVEQGSGLSFLPDYVTAKAVAEGRLVYHFRGRISDKSVETITVSSE